MLDLLCLDGIQCWLFYVLTVLLAQLEGNRFPKYMHMGEGAQPNAFWLSLNKVTNIYVRIIMFLCKQHIHFCYT